MAALGFGVILFWALVIFVLIVQSLITLIETRALKYRAVSERAP